MMDSKKEKTEEKKPHIAFLEELRDKLIAHKDVFTDHKQLSLKNILTILNIESFARMRGGYQNSISKQWAGILEIQQHNKVDVPTVVEIFITVIGGWIDTKEEKFQYGDFQSLRKIIEELYLLDAVCDLLSGKLHKLDPVIGDFGCQWRVPFILDTYDLVIKEISGRSDMTKVKGILLEYENLRYGKETLNQHPNVCSYIILSDCVSKLPKNKNNFKLEGISSLSGEISVLCNKLKKIPGYMDLHKNVTDILAKGFTITGFNAVEYLQLCKTFTANRIRTFDVFGLSGNPKEYSIPFTKSIASEKVSALANYSRIYMAHIAQQVCEWDERTFLNKQDIEEDSLARISHNLITKGAVYTTQQSTTYLTHTFYAPLRTIFAYQCKKKQPIVLDIRRLEYDPNKANSNDAYTFNGADVLYFEPNDFGDFVFVSEPSKEQMYKSAMCVECYSIVRTDYKGDTTKDDNKFHTLNFKEYIDFITQHCSPVTLIMASAVSHNELPNKISVKGTEISSIIKVDGNDTPDTIGEKINLSIVGGESFYDGITVHCTLSNTRIPLVGLSTSQWNIITERRMYKMCFHLLGVTDSRYKVLDRHTNTSLRTDSFVPIAPIHIYGTTFAIKWQRLQDFLKGLGGTKPRAPRTLKDEDCNPIED